MLLIETLSVVRFYFKVLRVPIEPQDEEHFKVALTGPLFFLVCKSAWFSGPALDQHQKELMMAVYRLLVTAFLHHVTHHRQN